MVRCQPRQDTKVKTLETQLSAKAQALDFSEQRVATLEFEARGQKNGS